MIHTINTFTIRQFGELDQTGNVSLLKKWYNPFPVRWFDTEKFYSEFKKIFNAQGNDIANEAFKLIAFTRILMLDRMLKMVSILMRNTNERSMFSMIFKTKPKTYEGNLQFYIDKIEELTGIKVKEGKDLTDLQNEIQRLLDKYKIRFEKKQEVKSDYNFIDIVLGVFSIMEMAYVPEMTLGEFARLKEMAEKKIKKLETKNNG